MPFFICPNCGHREVSGSRTEGFSRRPKGCSKCGFGFVFELLDDYYPAPNAAFFVCDQQGRVLDVGKGGFELTGLKDEQVIGRPVRDVLGLEWVDEGDGGPTADSDGNGNTDPIETTLECDEGGGAGVPPEDSPAGAGAGAGSGAGCCACFFAAAFAWAASRAWRSRSAASSFAIWSLIEE